jgi:flagellar biosynthesis/type III secretory pathway chaperone
MDQELNTSFNLLERRLALMRELASSLEQVQTAVVRSDLSKIDGHTIRQRELCETLRRLEPEVLARTPYNRVSDPYREHKIWVQLPDDRVSPEVRQRWNRLAQELTQVETQVCQLNQVYGALLRRAQRTLQIFRRVLAGSANTYAPPKCAPAIAPSSLQEVSHV